MTVQRALLLLAVMATAALVALLPDLFGGYQPAPVPAIELRKAAPEREPRRPRQDHPRPRRPRPGRERPAPSPPPPADADLDDDGGDGADDDDGDED